jgi:hypothetical protein
MGCFPEISKMVEINQSVPLLIPEPEGEEFLSWRRA